MKQVKQHPSPYKDKGVKKQKAIKFLLTPQEYKAMEILAQDWEMTLAASVRTFIGMSEYIQYFHPIILNAELQEYFISLGLTRAQLSKLDWQVTALKRFYKYWDKEFRNNLNDKEIDKIFEEIKKAIPKPNVNKKDTKSSTK